MDAIVAGDVATLERLLRQNPDLIRARSARKHRATLLHYVGANGVESWRQKTPANAVPVTEILLKAGADVDSVADMYGGSTTLGLVATSIHPLRAGVQDALMEMLFETRRHLRSRARRRTTPPEASSTPASPTDVRTRPSFSPSAARAWISKGRRAWAGSTSSRSFFNADGSPESKRDARPR